MIMKSKDIDKCIAIIPARGGSKRLPRKNIIDFFGISIIERVISNAFKSHLFKFVIVSTDDDEIADISEKCGAKVIMRDANLSDDKATVVQVCNDVLSRSQAVLGYLPEMFCCIYATAVLINEKDLTESYSLMKKKPLPDAVMGVSKYEIHPYRAIELNDTGFLTPKEIKGATGKSQNLPEYCASNGTIYWSRVKSFIKEPSFYPKKLKGYYVPRSRAVDIDTIEDLEFAKRLFKISNHDT